MPLANLKQHEAAGDVEYALQEAIAFLEKTGLTEPVNYTSYLPTGFPSKHSLTVAAATKLGRRNVDK